MIEAAHENLIHCYRGKDQAWGWCDLLFMAPPSLVRVAKATDDAALMDDMSRFWWNTSAELYNTSDYLYYRDNRFLGTDTYWSRGNGWVVSGLVRTLEFLPESYPSRAQFETQLREMAVKLKELQHNDGLWRSDLLNWDTSREPETSGSSFFCHGIAWGVRNGILDRSTFEPVVKKAWTGLVGCVCVGRRLSGLCAAAG